MRRTLRSRLLAASVAGLATIAFAACGDDDDTATTDGADVTLSTEVDTSSADTVTEETATDETVSDDTTDVTTDEGSTPSSGGGEVGSQEDYVEAAKQEVDFADQDINDCVAEAIVNDDVYAAIEDAGLTVEQFQEDGPNGLGIDESVASQIASDLEACGDLVPQVLTDEDQLACAEGNLTNEQMAEYLAYVLVGLEPSDEVVAANAAVEACLSDASTTTT